MNALRIDEKDNVAVVTEWIQVGMELQYVQDGTIERLAAAENIPIYHKAAIRDIAEGESVMKYGYVIGKAVKPIKKGEHVHCHNVVSAEEKSAAEE